MAMAMPGVKQALNVAIIIRSVDKFSRTFGLAASQAANLRGKYGALIGTISAMMDPYTIALSLVMAMATAMIKCAQAAMDFEYRMVEIRKVYQGSVSDIDNDLIPAIKSIGEQYGLTADEVAGSMVRWAQQGRKGAELQKLTEQAIRLTMVTMIGEAQATEYLTSAINQFGLSVEDTNHIIAVWNHLGNTQMVTAAFLAEALQDVGSSAREYGVSLAEASTYLTLLSRAGFKAGEAGKGLQMIFQKAFSDQSMKLLASVGISIYDANMNFRDMGDVLGELAGKWDSLSDRQRKQLGESMAGRRHIVKFNILMRDFADTTHMLASEQEMLADVEKEVNRTLDTAQKQMDILKSKVHNLALKIGEGFLPVIKIAAQELGFWVDAMNGVINRMAPFMTSITDSFLDLDTLREKYDNAEDSLKDYWQSLIDTRTENDEWLADLKEKVDLLAEENEWYNLNADAIVRYHKSLRSGNIIMAGVIQHQLIWNTWLGENKEAIDNLMKAISDFLNITGLLSDDLTTLEGKTRLYADIMNLTLTPAIELVTWHINNLRQQIEMTIKGFKELAQYTGIDTAYSDWIGGYTGIDTPVTIGTSPLTNAPIGGIRPFGGRIYKEAYYKLEPGEEVKTPGQASQSFGDIHIHISGVISGDASEWAKKLKDELKYELRGRGVM